MVTRGIVMIMIPERLKDNNATAITWGFGVETRPVYVQ
jgi:hypothetical protein